MLPEGSSKDALEASAERFRRLLPVYRQCRHSFHTLSVNVDAFSDDRASPAVLMVLSSDRWPTFREMFPGVKEDVLDRYGPAATLELPGQHIAMINRCLGNKDAVFTGAVERFLSDSFDDGWWWSTQLSTARKEVQPATTTASPVAGLIPLLSALSAPAAAPEQTVSPIDSAKISASLQTVA
eukprot:1979601-Prymnesium_polylepis.1